MAAGVVLDTSYLITLADPGRTHHIAARNYWRHFTENTIPIYVPTIVISEFYIKQQIPPDILRACVILPFNWDDAVKAAELDFSKIDRQEESRASLKDDVKIIAQAIVKDSAWIITDEKRAFYNFACELKEAGKAQFQPLKLVDGFDISYLEPGGQRQISYDVDPEEQA